MLHKIKRLIPYRFWPRLVYHRFKGHYFAKKAQYPARDMTVIGVTGTDGKTTTSQMIFHCLKQAGKHAGMLTTTTFAWNNHIETNETHKTSMSPQELNRYLQKMAEHKVAFLVLESSSHALDQGRLAGIPIHTAVITNLSHEHLDYHQTMEKYRAAKAVLFHKSIHGVTFGDDPFLEPLKHLSQSNSTFGTEKNNTVYFTNLTTNPQGISATIHYQNQTYPISIPMFGEYNMLNAVACIAACQTVNISIETCITALASFKGVPGRMEKVEINQPYTVLIDYAVTPQAFRTILPAVKKIDNGKLIAVFGACGDRDQSKRPILGKIASEICDTVIITDEEPYFENPNSIRDMIAAGVPHSLKNKVTIIPDRQNAIRHALQIAKPHDIIIITGMGNETSRIIGAHTVPWNEREIILQESKKLLSTSEKFGSGE